LGKIKCILCGNEKNLLIEEVLVENILKEYKKMFNQDVGYLFNTSKIQYCECNKCKLKFFTPQITGDEKFYNFLQKESWYYMDEKEEYNIAKEYISQSVKVLEIGAGKGAFKKYIETCDYTGLDFSKNASEIASKNGIKIYNESLELHSERNQEKYDVSISFQVLEHVENVKLFLESQLKCLKKGGKLIFAVPSEDSFISNAKNNVLNMPPHHLSRWSDDVFKEVAKLFDLELIGLVHEPLQEIHYEWYKKIKVKKIFSNKGLFENSKISKIMTRIFSRVIKIPKDTKGHTVIAIFKKK